MDLTSTIKHYVKLTLVFSIMLFSLSCEEERLVNTTINPEIETKFYTLNKREFSKRLMEISQLVDLRTPEEYFTGSINGAINISVLDEDFEDSLAKLDHGRPVFVFCQNGSRSKQAIPILKTQHFPRVYILKGGFAAWLEE